MKHLLISALTMLTLVMSLACGGTDSLEVGQTKSGLMMIPEPGYPGCPGCINTSTVELIAGFPPRIRVTVNLSSSPVVFPGGGSSITLATLRYFDDDGNNYTQTLGSDYSGWTAGTSHVVQFYAQPWLTVGDFPYTFARLTVYTDEPFIVWQDYNGS